MAKFCTECGTPVKPEQNFCLECGAKLINDIQPPSQAKVNVTPPPPPPPPPKVQQPTQNASKQTLSTSTPLKPVHNKVKSKSSATPWIILVVVVVIAAAAFAVVKFDVFNLWSKTTMYGSNASYKIKYDDSVWEPAATINIQDAEFEFYDKNQEMGAAIIAESVEVDWLELLDVATYKLYDGWVKADIVAEGEIIVNEAKVYMIQSKCYDNNVFYYGYFYTGTSGTIQAITWTSLDIMDSKKAELEDFLNGLIIQ